MFAHMASSISEVADNLPFLLYNNNWQQNFIYTTAVKISVKYNEKCIKLVYIFAVCESDTDNH